jgi:hypothetical protein
MTLALAIFAIIHPGRSLLGSESEFTKLFIQKGHRRWWCCGRRTRTRIDPDFEMSEWNEDGSTSPLDRRDILPRHERGEHKHRRDHNSH